MNSILNERSDGGEDVLMECYDGLNEEKAKPGRSGSFEACSSDQSNKSQDGGNEFSESLDEMLRKHEDLCKMVKDKQLRDKLLSSVNAIKNAVKETNGQDKVEEDRKGHTEPGFMHMGAWAALGSFLDYLFQLLIPVRQRPGESSYFTMPRFFKAEMQKVPVNVRKYADSNLHEADHIFLNDKLSTALKKHNLELKINLLKTPMTTPVREDPCTDGQEVSIVICPITNRLGSSVDSTLRKANCTGGRRVALLLFHHLPPHSPLALESDRVLTAEKYTKFGCIVDVMFWQGTGVYKCEMNSRGVEKLTAFILRNNQGKNTS